MKNITRQTDVKASIASNKDLLDLLERLSDQARVLGDNNIPRVLAKGLRAGMTTSEQLGGVRSALSSVRGELDKRYPEELRAEVDDAIHQIDLWFRRVNLGA